MDQKPANRWMSVAAGVTLLCMVASSGAAQDSQGFSASDVQVLYGWTFHQPGVSEDVPKSVVTFENSAAWSWGSSYLFVDVIRSWSDADANAKEVYGEWYPSASLRHLVGKPPSQGFVQDVSATLGINSGVVSTGSAPFVLLPGVTVNLKVPGFTFLSLGAYAYIDRGQFQGQPSDCHATTYQITPSWSLPFSIGGAKLKFDGFADFIGQHANCEAMIVSQPQLKVDISSLWGDAGRLYLGVEYDYWHNKYGISGLEDNVILPMLMWTL